MFRWRAGTFFLLPQVPDQRKQKSGELGSWGVILNKGKFLAILREIEIHALAPQLMYLPTRLRKLI